MRLTIKYHLVLIAVLLIGLFIIGMTSYTILQRHAREEVLKQASVLMEAALAMRRYTISEIKPLLALQNKRNFLPQSVPSYAATQNFKALRDTLPEYRYKEATLNPTNPRDRATDWESDIIQEFRNNTDAKHVTLVRDTPLGATLYYARPIRIKNQGCLTCHGMIDDAPKTMIALYGPANGFGWKMDEVVGSQVVSVPLSLPVERANETFIVLISITAGVFLILYFMLLFFFKKLFIDPMTLTTVIDNVTQEKEATPAREVAQIKDVAQVKAPVQDRSAAQTREGTQAKKEHPAPEQKSAVEIPESSIRLDLEDADEIMEEEQTISLQKMYQKHKMDELLLDEVFDFDDAVTGLSSDTLADSEKT